MSQSKYLEVLQPNEYYHVYSRTNNKELMFKCVRDRKYFLRKYTTFLVPYVKTYVYCLLGTHFHMLIQVRSEEAIIKSIRYTQYNRRTKIQRLSLKLPVEEVEFSEILSSQFHRFFTAYAVAFNKEYNRHGHLFHRPFKRVAVADDDHFTQLIYYIHANPSLHRIYRDFTNYPWSSYQSLLSNQATLLERKAVIAWFGNKDNFRSFHQTQQKLHIQSLMIEDT